MGLIVGCLRTLKDDYCSCIHPVYDRDVNMTLTRVWLSMTWCSKMMRRADALTGDPKASTPTSDPAYASEKKTVILR